jgi:hypothetical protein
MKLNLASGQDYLEGYINIDNKSMYHGAMQVDHEADILTMNWEKNVVEEIVLSHFAMYIGLREMQPLLERWYKWLKKGGRIIIETGNLKSICKYISSENDPHLINGSNGVVQLFGDNTTIGHKWCWCPETLAPLLYNAGFSEVKIGDAYFHRNPSRDFLMVGIK